MRYLLIIRDTRPDESSIRRLRELLKRMLRQCGYRCVKIEPVGGSRNVDPDTEAAA